MNKYNQLENKDHKPHMYRIRGKVFVNNKKENKYKEPYVSPYPITQVQKNGNVTLRQGNIQDLINTGWVKPYHE